jgi:hypothetical protein
MDVFSGPGIPLSVAMLQHILIAVQLLYKLYAGYGDFLHHHLAVAIITSKRSIMLR